PLSEREHMRNDRGRGSAVDQIIHETADGDQRFGLRLKSGTGGERRQPAQPPGPPRQFGNGIAQGGGIAALEAIGKNDDGGAARMRRWPRRRGSRAGASRASFRKALPVALAAKRRSTSASARAAASPDSLASSASSVSSSPRPSSCKRTISSSSSPA